MMYKLLYSSFLLLGVATATKKNVLSKNKKMEYIISDKKEKGHHRLLHETKDFGINGLKHGILSEEDAQELRNHGYNVEENKKLHPNMLHRKTVSKERRHLSEHRPSNETEVVAWGRDFALEDSAFFDNIMANTVPVTPVKVCVASSGIDIGHEDLPADRINGTNVKDVPEEWNEDTSGHGTHTAGIIAAIGNNNKGVKGIIDNDFGGKFELIIGKLAYGPGGSGTLQTQMDAIDNCIAMGANVVALTVGSYCDSDEEREYFDKIYKDDDVLVFSASGNKGDDSRYYPAAYPSVVSVIGVDHNKTDIKYDQSNKNEQVELAGPGTFMWSTTLNNTYEEWTGSGVAVAHVAGVAGILRSLFPTCKNHEIRAAMLATAKQKSDKNGCNHMFGHGVVQAKAAYDLLSQGACGGDIGEVDPVGGCDQLKNPTLDWSCAQELDCDDNDACTTDTCIAGICTYTHDCAACGLSEAVKVDIVTDAYSTETSWEILDGVTDEVLWTRDFEFGNCKEFYSQTKCFDEGSYLFVIYDDGFDGMCCDYGDGGYNVTVGDNLQVSGGKFKQVKATMFHVGAASAEPSMTSSPVTSPTTTNQPTGTWNPTSHPTNTMEPTSNTCASDADCDDKDSCTVDTCDSESKCIHVADCSLEGCGYKELITIDINTDNHPLETKWTVSNYENTTVLWRSPRYTDDNSAYSSSRCFPIGRYVFTIRDDADDGMCCDYGIGNYTALVNTKVYAQGSVFQDISAHLLFVRESNEPSSSPSDLPSTSPSDIPSILPSVSPSDVPSHIPSDLPSNVPSDVPSSSPSDVPSHIPSDLPSNVPSSSPSDVPSTSPSDMPSDVPSNVPSSSPSDVPSSSPSDVPSTSPSDIPSDLPSNVPSDLPSNVPSSSPSDVPSDLPSNVPSSSPSDAPSSSPSDVPSTSPSDIPSDVPSTSPSDVPSHIPSDLPSNVPSDVPSSSPSDVPSDLPSTSPSDVPSSSPSYVPSDSPSDSPSISCALEGESCKDGSGIGKHCCNPVARTLTCNLLEYKCEKFCANVGGPARGCGAANKEHIPPSCCTGLVCEDSHIEGGFTRICVEPETNVCSRTDVTEPLSVERKEGFNYGYAKGCGGKLAPNSKCCPGTACDHSALTKQYAKRCVDCASVDQLAAECDPGITILNNKTINHLYDFNATGMPKICCPGLECDPDDKTCKNTNCAADGKNSRECGAEYANKVECCEGHVCVGKSCVRKELLPCGQERAFAKECGVSWAPYFTCCEGFRCDPNPTGNFALCVAI